MKLSLVLGSALMICILLLGATYLFSRDQNEIPDTIAHNNTQIISSDNTMINIMNSSSMVNVTAVPNNNEIVEVVPSNGNLGTLNYGLQYGTNKYIDDATVTVYKLLSYNRSIYGYDMEILNIPGNPLNAANAFIRGTPVYQFTNVPYDTYIIKAEKNGKILASGSEVLNGATDGSVFLPIVDDPDNIIPYNCSLDKNTIYGWVRDMNGDSLPEVKVTLLRQQSYVDTPLLATDIKNNPINSYTGMYSGFFIFEDVTPGIYTISIENRNHSYNNSINFSGDKEGGFRSDQIFYYQI